MRGNAARTRRLLQLAAIAVVLPGVSACGSDEAPPAAPRTVLVAHPVAATDAAGQAYAGEVRAREEIAVSFRVGGKLVRRHVDVGDRVARGQLLAELDPGDLALQAQAAQAQLAAAQAELVRAGADRARFQALAEQQLVSRSALDAQQAVYAAAAGQARAARANLDVARNQAHYSRLLAPADGVIAARYAEAGQVVGPAQAVFGLAANGAREVAIALPETDIDAFKPGQPAQVELWSTPGARLPARIREISPAADAQTRTYAVRVALQPDAPARLGQSARVFFPVATSGGAPRLGVPISAVQRGQGEGASSAVWLVDPVSRRLRLAPVKLGVYGEDRVPVLSGLSASDWIVTAGGHLLRAGEVVAPVDRQNQPVLETIAAQPR